MCWKSIQNSLCERISLSLYRNYLIFLINSYLSKASSICHLNCTEDLHMGFQSTQEALGISNIPSVMSNRKHSLNAIRVQLQDITRPSTSIYFKTMYYYELLLSYFNLKISTYFAIDSGASTLRYYILRLSSIPTVILCY